MRSENISRYSLTRFKKRRRDLEWHEWPERSIRIKMTYSLPSCPFLILHNCIKGWLGVWHYRQWSLLVYRNGQDSNFPFGFLMKVKVRNVHGNICTHCDLMTSMTSSSTMSKESGVSLSLIRRPSNKNRRHDNGIPWTEKVHQCCGCGGNHKIEKWRATIKKCKSTNDN